MDLFIRNQTVAFYCPLFMHSINFHAERRKSLSVWKWNEPEWNDKWQHVTTHKGMLNRNERLSEQKNFTEKERGRAGGDASISKSDICDSSGWGKATRELCNFQPLHKLGLYGTRWTRIPEDWLSKSDYNSRWAIGAGQRRGGRSEPEQIYDSRRRGL